MKFKNSTTVIINKTEREILTRFEYMIDELDLDAEELEQLLYDISRGEKDCRKKRDILIKYEDD